LTGGLTGGHSYCAAPVLQKRSLAATLAAFITGIFIATIRSRFPFLYSTGEYVPNETFMKLSHWIGITIYLLIGIYVMINIVIMLVKEWGVESSESLVSFLIGIVYGGGIMISGALRPSIVIGFLTIDRVTWNPALLVLMFTVTVTNLIIFLLIVGKPQPFYEETYQLISD
jgi:hypothetical protein